MTAHLPEYDPTDPVETAVIRGLVRSWSRRATVRRTESALEGPSMEELFDPARDDYPEQLVPFAGHPVFEALDARTRSRILAWAWIAYNKNVVDVEQDVVTPGFRVLLRDSLGVGLSDTARASAVQAMVDEEYHTLMHLNASALVRRRRGWALPDATLPDVVTVRRQREAVASVADARAAALTTLAYATVAETSIADHLALIAEDETVQPVNRATVMLHRRDECAHASVAGELTVLVHERLPEPDRRTLVAAMRDGVDAFTATDTAVWSAILDAEHVPDADTMLREVAEDPTRRRFLQDCSGADRLLARLGQP